MTSTESTYAAVSAAMASASLKQRSIKFPAPPEVKDYEIVLALLVSFKECEIECVQPMLGHVWLVVFTSGVPAEEATLGFILKEKVIQPKLVARRFITATVAYVPPDARIQGQSIFHWKNFMLSTLWREGPSGPRLQEEMGEKVFHCLQRNCLGHYNMDTDNNNKLVLEVVALPAMSTDTTGAVSASEAESTSSDSGSSTETVIAQEHKAQSDDISSQNNTYKTKQDMPELFSAMTQGKAELSELLSELFFSPPSSTSSFEAETETEEMETSQNNKQNLVKEARKPDETFATSSESRGWNRQGKEGKETG